ncbi:MAG: putative ABC exporter domain-containing protein [Gemmatimonadaceae bacterium]
MTAALALLLFETTRNRFVSMARRLRSPRYAIGMALGLGYFWMVFGRQVARPAPHNDGFAAAAAPAFQLAAELLVFVSIAGIWVFGGDRSALAFSEAEVAMLLPAPVSRRTLVVYKLAQSQIVILINVAIWVLLLRRSILSSTPVIVGAPAIWVMFTTLSLHRMGAALARASTVEYRAAGAKRKWILRVAGFVMVAAVIAALIAVPMSVLYRSGSAPAKANDPLSFLNDLMLFMKSPGVQAVLYPARLVVAPLLAANVRQWAVAMVPALGIVALHVWWVLSSDAAFEEAAAVASEERAKRIEAIRTRRTVTAVPARISGTRTIALAPTGIPAVAIGWKNAISFMRSVKIGAVLRLPVILIAIAAVVGGKVGDRAWILGLVAAVMGILGPFFIVQVLRHDLRSDMLHLPFLKSLPLAGADLVLAEVLSTALPMVAVQFALFAVAGIAASMSSKAGYVPASIAIGAAIASPLMLIALDGAICTILNGSAVLFPGWIRLGPGSGGGIEMMGQNMLSMIATVVAFVLMLLIPLAIAATAWFALKANLTIAVTAACALAAIALASETYGLIIALGQAFERAEPQQIG